MASASPLQPMLWCLLSAALFAGSTPASKLLLDAQLDPLLLAGLLYLGAGLASLPFARRGGSPERRRDPANLRRLAGAVLAGGILGPLALLLGLRLSPAASVSLWLNLETTATALLAWAFFREHLHAKTWIANLLVLAGGLLLAAPGGFSLAPAALWVLLSCLCWGLDNNLTAIIDGYTPEQITSVKGLVAGSFSLLLALILGAAWPAGWVLGVALAVGALSYGASMTLYIRGAQQLGATRSQMIFATAPFLGMGMSWLVLGESVHTVQLLAAGLMLVALVLLLSDDHSHDHSHEAVTHTHAHRHDDDHHDHDHPGLPAAIWHTHEHHHQALRHRHTHVPDLHHRHRHS